jgi:hypothetical protein
MIDMKKNSGGGPGQVNENIFQGLKKISPMLINLV